MANKKRKSSRYQIRHGRLTHEASARRFLVWLRAGLLVLERDCKRLARVSEAGVAVWENGELFVKPKTAPEPSIRTNAQVVDAQYIYADGGEVRVTRDDRKRFTIWRERWGLADAEQMVAEFLANRRAFDMREQYGWL